MSTPTSPEVVKHHLRVEFARAAREAAGEPDLRDRLVAAISSLDKACPR